MENMGPRKRFARRPDSRYAGILSSRPVVAAGRLREVPRQTRVHPSEHAHSTHARRPRRSGGGSGGATKEYKMTETIGIIVGSGLRHGATDREERTMTNNVGDPSGPFVPRDARGKRVPLGPGHGRRSSSDAVRAELSRHIYA